MKKSMVARISVEEMEMIRATEGMSKSAKIVELFNGGLEVKEICTLLEIRYNHAYNVIQNYVIVNGIETEKTERAGGTKRKEIEAILLAGGKLIEAAKATKSSYNQVWQVSQALKKEMEKITDERIEEQLQEMLEEAPVEAAPKSKKGKKGQA